MTDAPLVVVQARAGSTRLPGKVLQDVGGMPMLGFQLARLGTVSDLAAMRGAHIVVATSDLPGDDAVAAVAADAGVDVVRGSETDVLGRYVLALSRHPAATVVRLTGDCPLTDPQLVADVVDLHRSSGADYTSNVLPRSYPKGLDVEVIAADALRAADHDATEPPDREHVTPFLYRRPGRFRLANLDSGFDLGEEWWTVDTAADLERVRAMVSAVAHAGLDPLGASWTDVLAVVGASATTPPGAVHLRPQPTAPAEQGQLAPQGWVRRWDVVIDGRVEGEVHRSTATGVVSSGSSGDDDLRDRAEQALDVLLGGDQASRPPA